MAKKLDDPSAEEEPETGRPAEQASRGAIPRRLPPRASPSPRSREERRQRRRRLDSLNLDSVDSEEEVRPRFLHSLRGFISPPDYNANDNGNVMGRADTDLEGQELYLHFLHERMRGEGVSERTQLNEYHDHSAHLTQDEDAEDDDRPDGAVARRRRRESMNLSNFQNPLWRQAGRDLQSLADQFARSQERELVKIRAKQVNVSSLSSEKFMDMLKELFQGGQITRERILVLFFFCSDLAIEAIRCKMEGALAQITAWTLTFIKDQVCSWVHQHGGWQSVLTSGLNVMQQVAVIGMCVAVIGACVFYVKRGVKN